MNNLIDRTDALIDQAINAGDSKQIIKEAVAAMTREDIEALATAYLLSEVKKRTPRPIKAAPVLTEEQQRKQAEAEAKAELAYAERMEHVEQDFKRTMARAFNELKNQWRFDWTNELLNAEIRMTDGTTVLLGDATREQHTERIRVHRRNTVLNMEAAIRHERAIDVLNQSGATTLRQALT